MHHIHTITVKADESRVRKNVVEDLQVLQVFRGFLAPHLLAFGPYVPCHQFIDDAPCLNGYQPLTRRLIRYFHRLPQRKKDGGVETATKLPEMKMSRTANLRVGVDNVT